MKRPAGGLFSALLCVIFCCGFAMPVRRNAHYTDTSGKSWREAGSMSVSVTAARQTWEVALKRDGWQHVKTIPIEADSHKTLEIWRKQGTAFMLCTWRISSGTSGYMWGTIRQDEQQREPAADSFRRGVIPANAAGMKK